MPDDPSFCDICGRYRVSPNRDHSLCCCKGIQPYALSVYPGEFRLTATHPSNDDEQWYPRIEIDPLLERLKKAEEDARERALPLTDRADFKAGWAACAKHVVENESCHIVACPRCDFEFEAEIVFESVDPSPAPIHPPS